jgi:hypothetical protein
MHKVLVNHLCHNSVVESRARMQYHLVWLEESPLAIDARRQARSNS